MANSRSPSHTKEAWEAQKATIRHLYLAENATCREIRDYLTRHSFAASERQIKNRLSEWQFECKKTRAQHYLAMMAVANAWCSRGFDIIFDVPKRQSREEYTIRKIRKECDRIRKKSEKHQSSLVLPSLGDAQRTLKDADFTWRCASPQPGSKVVRPPFNSLSTSQVSPSVCGSDYATSVRPARQESIGALTLHSFGSLSSPDRSISSISSNASSPGGLYSPPASLSGSTVAYTPESWDMPNEFGYTLNTAASLDLRATVELSIAAHHSWSTSSSGSTANGSKTRLVGPVHSSGACRVAHSGGYSPYEPPVEPGDRIAQKHACLYVLEDPSVLLANRAMPCQPPNRHWHPNLPPDFDLLDPHAKLAFDSPDNTLDQLQTLDYSNATDSPAISDSRARKIYAARRAAPCYFSTCPEGDIHRDSLECSKHHAIQILKYSLKEDSRWVLPCLIWMMTILSSNSRWQTLIDFLTASCDIIDADTDTKGSFNFAVPYHYTLAFLKKDCSEMERWGNGLPGALAQISNIWGENHPNFLGVAIFSSWHHLHHGEHMQAIDLLGRCLPLCEHVMGRHSIMTINCLTILGRAYRDIHQYVKAKSHIECALRRLGDPPPGLENKRHHLEVQLADLELGLGEAGDLQAAEQHLLNAVHGCAALNGVDNRLIWYAIQNLGNVFARTGRPRQTEELLDYMQKCLDLERDLTWYMANEVDPPPTKTPDPPPWWPGGFCEGLEVPD